MITVCLFPVVQMKSLVLPASLSVKSWPPMKVHDIWSLASKGQDNKVKDVSKNILSNSTRSSKGKFLFNFIKLLVLILNLYF